MASITISVIMDFSEYENIEIFNKTQRFDEINMSDSSLREIKTAHMPMDSLEIIKQIWSDIKGNFNRFALIILYHEQY